MRRIIYIVTIFFSLTAWISHFSLGNDLTQNEVGYKNTLISNHEIALFYFPESQPLVQEEPMPPEEPYVPEEDPYLPEEDPYLPEEPYVPEQEPLLPEENPGLPEQPFEEEPESW